MKRKMQPEILLFILMLGGIFALLIHMGRSASGTAETPAAPQVTTTTSARIAEETFPPPPDTTVITAPQTTSSPADTTTTTADTTTTAAATTTTTAAPVSDWRLTLVNATHPVPADWQITLTELRGGVSVDSRMYPSLQKMFDDMRAEGLRPFVREGYRTNAYQQEVMQTRINTYLAQGYSQAGAEAEAKKYVAEPGTSEHELGLAVDINSEDADAAWSVYAWLKKNASKYGFILRYPDGKTDITGINYEPWHYRYVGEEAAAEIMESGLTLEEYLGA